MNLQEVNASSSPEVQMNENAETLEWASVYGKRHPVTDGLTWGYWGGRWGGFSIAAGTLTLTDNTTNYVVVARATGAISVSSSIANWANTVDYARVYKIATAAGAVLGAPEDHRAGRYGVFGGGSTTGRHEVPIMAAAMRPSITNGCAALAAVEITSTTPNVVTLDFDQTSVESAQFVVPMPKSWNRSTVSFRPIWSHSGGTSFGVVWELQGVALQDGDAMGTTFGTAQSSTDTGGTTNDIYIGPESSAITVTVASPATDDTIVFFQVSRNASSGSDTLDADARLHGVILIIETNEENDE